jgi:release factor glutamine methyltransferase
VSADGAIAWATLLQEATERLGAMDAQRIVEEVTGAEPGELHRVLDDLVTERGIARFDTMVQRRSGGEPLQYVLGRWGFRTLDLMVDSRVLIPRPETEVVAGFAIDVVQSLAKDRVGDVLAADLGCGSGAIALSIAVECPTSRVFATDASTDALVVARANLSGIGRAATRVSVSEGGWFEALPDVVRGTLDVVISNPPYVGDDEVLPEVVADWEPAQALRSGSEGLDDLRHIVDEAGDWLAPRGTLILEMAPDQTETVAEWCRHLSFTAEIRPDLAGRPRAVIAQKEH